MDRRAFSPAGGGALYSAALLALGAAGCQCSNRDAAQTRVSDQALRQTLGTPHRVAAGDLDGDGEIELIAADEQWLRVVGRDGAERARLPAPGGIQVLRSADVDGDGRAEILAGWGRSREHQDAPARVSLYRLEGGALAGELVAQPRTSRSEVVEILPVPGAEAAELLLAHFESKYMVRISRARLRGEDWELSPIETIRMATSFALGDVDGDGETDLVVGRVYGDDIEADGDAFILRPDGGRVPIPVTGGVRSLALMDRAGEEGLDLLIGDGWRRNYAREARARLTRARWSAGAFRSQLLEESAGEFTLWQLLVADLDGEGGPEIVTRGNAKVRILSRRGESWQARTVAARCRDAALLDLDEAPGPAILLACEDGVRIVRGGDGR